MQAGVCAWRRSQSRALGNEKEASTDDLPCDLRCLRGRGHGGRPGRRARLGRGRGRDRPARRRAARPTSRPCPVLELRRRRPRSAPGPRRPRLHRPARRDRVRDTARRPSEPTPSTRRHAGAPPDRPAGRRFAIPEVPAAGPSSRDEDGTVGPSGSGGRGNGEVSTAPVHKPGRDHGTGTPRSASGGTRPTDDARGDRGARTARRPTPTRRLTIADFGAGADRRPQLRHRPVLDPAVPAADLPGLRNPVRDPLGGARLDQPDRDRLRHQPERLHRRRARLDAVHALDLGDVRRRRQRRRAQGPLQPGRRDLRRGPLPEGRRRPRTDLRTAIFAYNHADWYVDEVLLYANQYGKLPSDLVGSLTGLTEGAHFPVAANARYADDISERRALEAREAAASAPRQRRRGDLELAHTSRDRHLLARRRPGGRGQRRRDHRDRQVEAARPLHRPPGRLRQPLHLRAARQVADATRCRSSDKLSAEDFELVTPGRPTRSPDRAGAAPGRQSTQRTARRAAAARPATAERPSGAGEPVNTEDSRERLYAYPERPRNAGRADLTGQLDTLLGEEHARLRDLQGLLLRRPALRPQDDGAAPAAQGLAGHRRHGPRPDRQDRPSSPPTSTSRSSPAGRGAPKIDPKPILDGWKLLEATAIYRAAGKNPFDGAGDRRPGPADVEGAADAPGARRPAPRDLRLRPRGHPHRPDRPPRAGDARVPGRARLPADDHLAQVRPQHPDHARATSASTPPATRSTSRRSTASRSSATRARARSPRRWSATCCSCRARWSRTRSSR